MFKIKLRLAALILGVSLRDLEETLVSVAVDADCDGEVMYGIYLEPETLGLREAMGYYREFTRSFG